MTETDSPNLVPSRAREYRIERTSYAIYVYTYENGECVETMVNRNKRFDPEAYVAKQQAFDAVANMWI
jgi:hypothetical protein